MRKAQLTVVGHWALEVLLPSKHVVVVPLPIAVLAIAICGKVWSEFWPWSVGDMEVDKEEPGDGTNGAELD